MDISDVSHPILDIFSLFSTNKQGYFFLIMQNDFILFSG